MRRRREGIKQQQEKRKGPVRVLTQFRLDLNESDQDYESRVGEGYCIRFRHFIFERWMLHYKRDMLELIGDDIDRDLRKGVYY